MDGMSGAVARICGGHLVVAFTTRARVVDGRVVVTLAGHRAYWDGLPVSDVVAEALAVAWCAAQDDDTQH